MTSSLVGSEMCIRDSSCCRCCLPRGGSSLMASNVLAIMSSTSVKNCVVWSGSRFRAMCETLVGP
eukprot:233959-Prorocentrum_lima.AAC.1